jgi:hypothetical protein
MNDDLIKILRRLTPTGSQGFEGLIAQLLEQLTGRRFYLARSGSQGGRDLSSDFQNFSVIAVECKRYGEDTEFDVRNLLGEMAQASQEIPDLDLWVLVASRSIPAQLVTVLTTEAHRRGIEFLPISADQGSSSSLAVLCAQAADVALRYVQDKSSDAEQQEVARHLNEILANPGYGQALQNLRASFSPVTIGFEYWRVSQNRWLTSCFQSEAQSRAEFGQPVNVGDERVQFVERRTAWTYLNAWFSKWSEDHHPFVLLGEEGDGKTWAVASWLSQKIQQDE